MSGRYNIWCKGTAVDFGMLCEFVQFMNTLDTPVVHIVP